MTYDSRKKKKILNQLTLLFGIFVVVMIFISALATYVRQSRTYRELCTDRIRDVGDYLSGLISEEGDDFVAYTQYYRDHYKEMRIPYDLTGYTDDKEIYERDLALRYAKKTPSGDISISDLPDDLKLEYYTYRHEYWILVFEKARESFDLPYTYFLLPDEDEHKVVYMIDGERTEDADHPGYMYLGDTYFNDPEKYTVLWDTWSTGQEQNNVMEFDNSWGHTYAYYVPVVIDGQKLGLIAAEIDVGFVNREIARTTIMLCTRLAFMLIIFSALLLHVINVRYVMKINYLSEQIDSFSSTGAPEIVDAIRGYDFEPDEVGTLATNTADMIVEIKDHEEAVKRAADMKSDFLANMSHEIRTPMNAVVGMSELILREDITPKARDYASQIKASGQTLLTVINDILDFSKIESGNMDIVPRDYEPAKLVEDVTNLLVLNNRNRSIEVRTEIDPALPKILKGDDTRIRQILTNIMSNALKFTREGVVLVSIDHDRTDDENVILQIRVSDTGIGIAGEDLDNIFESFSQVKSTRNREVEGTGLGLAITKRLVELMDGTISVESELGKGSVFTVQLPQKIIAEGESAKLNDDGSSIHTGGFRAPSAKILVVDDNQVNLFIMSGLLETYDIRPTSVASGPEAIKEAGSEEYDIVFMDHMMPQMDGAQAAHLIREKYPVYRDIPMIAFTANAVDEARDMLMREGFNDFLSKPVEPEKLALILKKWIPADKIRE